MIPPHSLRCVRVLAALAAVFLAGGARGQTITRNCEVGGTMEIGNVQDIFPPGDFARMDVLATTVPGVSHGAMWRISTFGEEIQWGTTAPTPFAPSQSPSFNQNRIPANNAFRYVNNGTGMGTSESIPIRFSNLTGSNTSNATLVINIVAPGNVPVITSQPQPLQTVPTGTSATLNVVAEGTEPLYYQWYEGFPPSTFLPISGATSSTYTTPPITISGQYHYWVRVYNNVGGVASNGVTVNAGYPPTAYSGGPYQVPELQTITLNGSATDPDSQFIAYAWDFNSNNVYGEISSQFGAEGGQHPTFSADILDGPRDSVTITLRATDNTDVSDYDTTVVQIVNAPPRATFTSNGAGAVVGFSNFIDAPGDLAAGFTFGYDFDNDGTFEITGSASSSANVPGAYLAGYNEGRPVRGRITDRDGGSTDYLANIDGAVVVVTTLADENNGTAKFELGTAGNSFREAVALAEATPGGNAILFDAALLASPGAVINVSSTSTISSPVSIYGPWSGNGIALAGSASVRCFDVTATGTLKLDRMTLRNFSASGAGGAIHSGGSLVLLRSTFQGNQAFGSSPKGGAVYSEFGSVTAENCTFTGNSVSGGAPGGNLGGAIFSNGSSITLTATTISGNIADSGRGLFLRSDGASTASAALKNCVLGQADASVLDFAIDSVNGGATPVSSGEGNLVCSSFGFAGSSIGGDPLLSPLADNGGVTQTMSPTRASPLVNRGVALPGVPTDQRGMPRPFARRYDIGAVEFDGLVESLVVTTLADEDDYTSDTLQGTGTSLREALYYAGTHAGADTITFSPGLSGTIGLTNAWENGSTASVLEVAGQDVTIQGTSTSPGITLQVLPGANRRHLFVAPGASLTLAGLTFTGGVAADYGGSVWSQGSLTVRGCTFTGNTAGSEGGAIQSWGDSPLLLVENSTFSGNASNGIAGAVDAGAMAITLRHLTVSNNSATNGNALVIWKYAAALTNCLIAGNTGDGIGLANGGSVAASSSNNILGSGGTGGLTNGVNGNLTGVAAPRLYLGALADNGGPTRTIALLPGSVAVNAGTAAGLATDQRGVARPAGPAPDVGAYEDPAGDSDPDRDGLPNLDEMVLNTDPLAIDSDNDGYNDATEMLSGSSPTVTADVPPATHIERVLGFGPARGLDLSGNFLYALNIGIQGAAGTSGDAGFTADSTAGASVSALHEIADWTSREFGNSSDDNTLETVFHSIRWTSRGEPDPASRSLKVDLANLVPDRNYKLQLLVGEGWGYDRVFDVRVNGALLVSQFHTGIAQGLTSGSYTAAAVVHDFTASSSTLNIELSGENSPGNVDGNPILNGLTLEEIPTPAAAPVITPGSATFEGSVGVSISTTALGATVYYTLDGSTPSASHGTPYGGPFTLMNSSTVRAIAVGNGWLPSTVSSTGYTVITGLESWRATQGLAADGSQDLLNPSGDGIANLLKFAFNMAPNAGDLAAPNLAVLPEDGNAGLPRIGIDQDGRLVIRFVRRKGSTNPGISYVVETGDDLAALAPLDLSGALVESIDTVWERVTAVDPTITPKRFGRVAVGGFHAYSNNFDAGLGAATLRGSAVWTGGAVRLTQEGVGGETNAVVFDGIAATPALNGFTARFNLALGPVASGIPADGASFAVGNLGTGAWSESGPGTPHSLAVGFDTYDNGGTDGNIGIHVFVNGVHQAAQATNPYTGGAFVPVEIRYDASAGLTVLINGSTIFSNLPVSGFSFPANGAFGISARTGGSSERAVVDDVVILPR